MTSRSRRYNNWLLILPILFAVVPAYGQHDPFKVLDPYHGGTNKRMVWMEYTDAHNALYHYLKDIGQEMMSERAAEVAGIDSLAGWMQRQEHVKQTLHEIVGPFPERTPLNARITGRLQRPGYTVETVTFESQPGFLVTGALFLPDERSGKTPAILYCCGHSSLGFRADHYQQVVINLVKKGFIVFAFDPIGQGERLQYFDPETGESKMPGATREHSYPGNQCFVTGASAARYFVWDGIRALDYLASRPEVDADRLGCTGNSGGGVQTAYISAIDERVKAAAVSGYFTNFKWILKTLGVQDAEQNLYRGWAHGIDLPDYIQVRAPKPMLMMVTTRDFFPIRGAREAYRESLAVYNAYHQPENLQIVEDDSTHGYTQKTRETMYAFFQRHLEHAGDSTEEEAVRFTVEELQVTEPGQVVLTETDETIFTLNRVETAHLLERLNDSRTHTERHRQNVIRSLPAVSGYPEPDLKPVDSVMTGQYSDDILIEKRFIEGVGDYPIPFLLMFPRQASKRSVVMVLDPDGKASHTENHDLYQFLLDSGHIVAIPDLINTGETGPSEFLGDATINGVSSNIWYMGVQSGVSIVGIRAADVNRLSAYLGERFPDQPLAAVSRGQFNSVLLHACVMNPKIESIAMIQPLISYESLVMNEHYDVELIHSAPSGVLKSYDLPDLAAAIAPTPILMIDPRNSLNEPVAQHETDELYSFTRSIYERLNASNRFVSMAESDSSSVRGRLAECFE